MSEKPNTTCVPVMNPPAQAEAGNRNTALHDKRTQPPRAEDKTGLSSGSEARPVTPTEQITRKPKRQMTCEQALNMMGPSGYQTPEDREAALLAKITEAVREADVHFDRVGGSSKHWVRDCFLPMLEKHGLRIVGGSV